MKKLLTLLSILFSLHSFSQTKVTLASTSIQNEALPSDFSERVFWKQTDLFKFNLDQLAGSIIYRDSSDNNFSRGPRLVDQKNALQVKAVEKGQIYHHKLNKGFGADLKLFIFSAAISDDQVVDLKITDLLYVMLPYEKLPIEDIIKAGQAIPEKQKKYYIQGALLTSIDKQFSTKVSKKGSITGSAFAVNGNVYAESETSTIDYRISLTLIDIDKLIFQKGAKNFTNVDDIKVAIEASKVTKSMIIKLNGF